MKTAAGLRIAKSDSGSFVFIFLLFDRMSEPGQRSTCTIIEGESTLRVFGLLCLRQIYHGWISLLMSTKDGPAVQALLRQEFWPSRLVSWSTSGILERTCCSVCRYRVQSDE